MLNWKSPGPNGVQGYWIKHLSNLHSSIALQLEDASKRINYLNGWLLEKLYFVQKKFKKEIWCQILDQSLTKKLLTGILAEELYEQLEKTNSLPWEQKVCRKRSRGTKDQLLIDKMMVKYCKRRLTSLAVAWIDYRKAYGMVPHSWIQTCMEMFRVAVNVRSFANISMKQWNTELTASNQRLRNVKMRGGIFQGDGLSPLLFVLVMIPFTFGAKADKVILMMTMMMMMMNWFCGMVD